MKIRVYVSQEKAIQVGSEVSGFQDATIELAKLNQRQRDELAQLSSSLTLSTGTVSEEAIIAALDREADEREKRAAEKAARFEKDVVELLALPQDRVNQLSEYHWREVQGDPRLADKKALRDVYLEEQRKQAIARAEEERVREARREGKRAEQKAAAEKEIAAWIAKYGSERLKLGHEGNYDVHSLYLTERAAMELGESWEVDTADRADSEERIAPSLEALMAVKALPEGITGEVVWLTKPPHRDEEFEPCEAIRVTVPWTDKDIYKRLPEA